MPPVWRWPATVILMRPRRRRAGSRRWASAGGGWPQAGRRDPVIAGARARLPGLRPCGFPSRCEAAAWPVLAQRLRIARAARLRAELIARHGQDGAFPPPRTRARLDLDLPGRKS
jgi:DNA-3-methyladenine glycosylase II